MDINDITVIRHRISESIKLAKQAEEAVEAYRIEHEGEATLYSGIVGVYSAYNILMLASLKTTREYINDQT